MANNSGTDEAIKKERYEQKLKNLKEQYKYKLNSFESRLNEIKVDIEGWRDRVLTIESQLKGMDYLFYDEASACYTAKAIAEEMASKGHWRGKIVDERQVVERAERLYPRLLTKIGQEFLKYSESERKKWTTGSTGKQEFQKSTNGR